MPVWQRWKKPRGLRLARSQMIRNKLGRGTNLGFTLGSILLLGACMGDVTGDPPPEESSAQVGRLPAATGPFAAFESLQVRPVAMSPSGNLLFATNTPDNRLEIFRIGSGGGVGSAGPVVVGLEPVAVAARTDNEVWVVNHLSDSVS